MTAERVRVTGPPRRPRPRTRSGEIDEQSPLGEVYVESLLRAQLGAALRTVAILAASVGSLPLAFYLAPDIFDVSVVGIPLAWWLLGVGVYPLLLLLGWRFVVRAERNEADFADLVNDR